MANTAFYLDTMLRPFGPAISVIYTGAAHALSRKHEPPVDYIAARYPANYAHTSSQAMMQLLIGEARHITEMLDHMPVHKQMLNHYSQNHKMHERYIILDSPTAVLHVTVSHNTNNSDTLVLRTELLA